MPDATAIGKLIRSRRIAAGMSQARLAAVLHQTPTTVRRWERAEADIPDDLVPALAAALDLDADELRLVTDVDKAIAGAAVVDEAKGDPVPPPPRPTPPPPDRPPPGLDIVPPVVSPAPAPVTPVPVAAAPPPPVVDLPTQPVAMPPPPRSRPLPTATVVRPPVEPPVSYMQDPAQRRIYVVRWIATAAVLAVLAYLFVWSAAEVFGIVDDVLNFLTDDEDAAALLVALDGRSATGS